MVKPNKGRCLALAQDSALSYLFWLVGGGKRELNVRTEYKGEWPNKPIQAIAREFRIHKPDRIRRTNRTGLSSCANSSARDSLLERCSCFDVKIRMSSASWAVGIVSPWMSRSKRTTHSWELRTIRSLKESESFTSWTIYRTALSSPCERRSTHLTPCPRESQTITKNERRQSTRD
jgi:hypothetical protein